jgi:CRP-like cAMP-binding protein
MDTSEYASGPAASSRLPDDATPRPPFGALLARLWRRAGAPVKVIGLLSAATTSIVAAGVSAGIVGALVAGGLAVGAGALALIAIPVTGFTRSQAALVKQGQEFAASVEDVRLIMQDHAAAYNVIFRRLPAGQFHRDLQTLPQAGVIDGPGHVQAPEKNWHASGVVLPNPHGATREVGSGRERGHEPQPGNRGEQAGDALASWTESPADHRSTPTFWELLTPSERKALTVTAQQATYEGGTFLCRQGERADHVIIIRSGWTRVYTEHPGGSRVIAERGRGDIIGERAVMMVRWRSASVIALEPVEAFIIPDEDFSKFLLTYPRVNAVLEHQVYQRLTEDHGKSGSSAPMASWTGQICPIILTDITAFTSQNRNDEDRLSLRRIMYSMLQEAFEASDLSLEECHEEDRGDGTLIVIPPTVPASTLLDGVVSHLASRLGQHNQSASGALHMQLRVALHAGPVTRDAKGVAGNAINLTARLVEAEILQKNLKKTQADLGVITSDYIYDNVIRQRGHQPMDAEDYRMVSFQSKESMVTAWIYLAGTRTSCALGD